MCVMTHIHLAPRLSCFHRAGPERETTRALRHGSKRRAAGKLRPWEHGRLCGHPLLLQPRVPHSPLSTQALATSQLRGSPGIFRGTVLRS